MMESRPPSPAYFAKLQLQSSLAMPEETSPPTAPPAVSPEPPQPKTNFNIGEEFGTAKKNLPPVKILLIGAALILVAWGIAALLQRPKTSATGSIDQVVSVEVPNQNMVLVAINVAIQNHGTKPFWIHTIKADVDTTSGSFSADPTSAMDFDRYFQAFPALKEDAIAPLQPESKIAAGGQLSGTIVVGFPLTADAFAGRKSLKVTIQPYDQPAPLVLTK
jgi:hypothetical protein